ncbi:hypothetical protein AQUCO_00600336v1 [Aquilegia coerulea]|uniref:MATH domain-containing protein n=1 Tax=Aquilegia coerulea TaxID=218851 RepID=A0A2G5EP77_AQUCA|nr:hypothetical protein AQUCO_00600336v1 [Aquilegia coerulea]
MEGLSRSPTQPTLFRFKIESFSLLSTSSLMENFESCEFDAKGYKWKLLKLALYANGNEERGGKDHISLYLVLADSSCNEGNKELLVSFSLLVFDHVKGKHLKVHSVSRFHAMKSESGFDKLLPLKNFNDPSNGYLVDDTCMFGVESWKIEKFSELEDEYFLSEFFTVEGHAFEFWLYPKGDDKGKGNFISLYFGLADNEEESPDVDVFVEYMVRVVDQVNRKHQEKREMGIRLCSSREFQGWSEFISLSNINNSTTGYLVNDTLILEAEVTVHHSVQSQV